MPTNLLRGRKCPKCSYGIRGKKRTKSQKEFLKKALANNPTISIIGDYHNAHTKIRVMCAVCKHEWDVHPQSVQRGAGCPKCSRTGTSFVEQTILLSLEKILGEKLVSRSRTLIGMELDIYIPSKNLAIEYGAWPWHVNKKEKDKKKFELCSEKGIRLIEIFDAFEGEIDNNQDIWVYKENISKLENIDLVFDIIKRLCGELNQNYELTEDEKYEIIRSAKYNARRNTTQKLNKTLEEKNYQVEVISEYEDALSKVLAKCKVCGNKWMVIPASLLRGLGCPKCANNKKSEKSRKKHDEFINELIVSNPNIEVLGIYSGTHNKIEVRCRKHDVVWRCAPNSLLNGAGCDRCKNEKISISQRKTNEQFYEESINNNDKIEVIGKYVNSKKRILVKCNICGREWNSTPDLILRGAGCSECSKLIRHSTRRKTTSEFKTEVSSINSWCEVIGEYINNRSKIRIRCIYCNNEWDVIPKTLIKKLECKYCKDDS